MNITQSDIDSVRNYLTWYNSLPASCDTFKKKSFFISTSDIRDLLSQGGTGTLSDGIRVYFGADMVEGNMIPTIKAVAVNGVDDFGTQQASAHPCPYQCSGTSMFV